MKKTTLALSCLFAAASAFGAPAAKPLPRKAGGAFLGMSAQQARKSLKAQDAPKMLADLALPGEDILILPGAKEKQTGGFLGHFREGKLRRLEWTYEKSADWETLLKAKSKRHGLPSRRQNKVDARSQDVAEWTDGKTHLDITRDPRPDGLHVYGSIQDVALTEAAYKAFAAAMAKPSSKEQAASAPAASPAAPTHCLDFSTCYNLAAQQSNAGQCAEALRLYSQAIELKPDHPWAWFHRALIKKALGDGEGAAVDFAGALQRKANASDFDFKSLPDPKAYHGPRWSCAR